MVKLFFDEKMIKRADKAEEDLKKAKQALENQQIDFAISLLDILDIETIAAKTKLSIDKVRELKEKY